MRSSGTGGGAVLASPDGWAGFRRGHHQVVAFVLAALAAGACVLVGRSLGTGRVSLVVGGLAAALLCGALVRFTLRYRAERPRDGRITTSGAGETVIAFAAGHVATQRVAFAAAGVTSVALAVQLVSLPFDTWAYAGALVCIGVGCWGVACFAAFPLRGGRGIALSPAGVRVVGHERTRGLAWTEIAELVPHVRHTVQLPTRWLLLCESGGRYAWDSRSLTPPARFSSSTWTDAGIEVACDDLDLDPVVLFHLIRFYRDHPDRRPELGTTASVERVRRRDLPAADADRP